MTFYAEESERVLAAVLYANRHKREAVTEHLRLDHLHDPLARAVFTVVAEADELDEYLLRQRVAEQLPGRDAHAVAMDLESLRRSGAYLTDPQPHLAAVIDAWRDSEVLHLARAAYEQAKRREGEASTTMQQALDLAAGIEGDEDASLFDAAKEAYRDSKAAAAGTVPLGYMHGLPFFDEATGGGRGGEVCLIGARAKMGKSELAMQMLLHMARDGIASEVFSLEMNKRAYARRYLSGAALVRGAQQRTGNMSTDEWTSLLEAVKAAQALPIHLHSASGLTVPAFRAKMQRAKRARGAKVACIDYAQLMTYQPGNSREEQATATSRALHQAAVDLDVYLLLLTQFPNGATDNEVPQPTKARESGAWAQDCDRFLIKHRIDRGTPVERMLLWHPIERHGELGGQMEYEWNPEGGGHVEVGPWKAKKNAF